MSVSWAWEWDATTVISLAASAIVSLIVSLGTASWQTRRNVRKELRVEQEEGRQ